MLLGNIGILCFTCYCCATLEFAFEWLSWSWDFVMTNVCMIYYKFYNMNWCPWVLLLVGTISLFLVDLLFTLYISWLHWDGLLILLGYFWTFCMLILFRLAISWPCWDLIIIGLEETWCELITMGMGLTLGWPRWTSWSLLPQTSFRFAMVGHVETCSCSWSWEEKEMLFKL